MVNTSQLPPLAEQRAALNAAWHQMERAEAERELLMELLREVHLAWVGVHANQFNREAVNMEPFDDIDDKIVLILRGKPVAEVLRPDEDADMDVPF